MADLNTNYVYTIGGYATLVGVGYAIYHMSTTKTRQKAAASQSKSVKSPQAEPRKEDRKKKQRLESFTSESQASSEKASKLQQPAKALEPIISESKATKASARDDGADDAAFARQLAKAQQGKQFNTKSDSGKKKQKEKTVKQSRANKNNNASAEEKTSAPSASSTNGADADDDQSPAQSPAAAPADSTGVADMLEPAAAAPSVLRLTETEPKEQKKKVAKPAEVVETKKQRQNRKKAEAAKAARDEAEKERKVLEEKQRRAARIGEGRAAKDGSQYTNAAVSKSAWTQGSPNGQQEQAAASNSSWDLLDTVDTSAKTEAAPKAKQAVKPKAEDWPTALPTEDEQLELLKQEEDEWSTVKTKASKRAAKKETTSSGEDAPAKTPAPAAQAQQPVPAPAAVKPKGPQNFGSFSALTSKDEPVEEVEEEWEV